MCPEKKSSYCELSFYWKQKALVDIQQFIKDTFKDTLSYSFEHTDGSVGGLKSISQQTKSSTKYKS